MEYKIEEHLEKLIGVPESVFKRVNKDVGHCIIDALIQGQGNAEIDMGYGKISVWITGDDQIRYRFVPSQYLEERILDALATGENPIKALVEKRTIELLKNAYRGLE